MRSKMSLLKSILFDTRGPHIDCSLVPIRPDYETPRHERAAIALEATIEEFLSENAKLRGAH